MLSSRATVSVPWWPTLQDVEYSYSYVLFLVEQNYWDLEGFAPGAYIVLSYFGSPPAHIYTVMARGECGNQDRALHAVTMPVKANVAVVCGQYFKLINVENLNLMEAIVEIGPLDGIFDEEDPIMLYPSAENYTSGDGGFVWVIFSKDLYVFKESSGWYPEKVWSSSDNWQLLDFKPFSTCNSFHQLISQDNSNAVSCSTDNLGTMAVHYHYFTSSTGSYSTTIVYSWSDSSNSCDLEVGDFLSVDGDDTIILATETSYITWITVTPDFTWKQHELQILLGRAGFRHPLIIAPYR